MAFVDSPDEGTASRLLAGWSPDETLMPEIQQEIRLQVGWAALDLLLATGSSVAVELSATRVLRFPNATAPGWWERCLQQAGACLVVGDVDEAVRRVQLILQNKPPAWAPRRVQLELTRLAPLAGRRTAEWLQMCPGGLPNRQQAPSTALAAAATLANVLSDPNAATPSKLRDVIDELRMQPWTIFGAFLLPALRESLRDYLANELMNLSDQDWSQLPWGTRAPEFAAASANCGDHPTSRFLARRARTGPRSDRRRCTRARDSAWCAPETMLRLDLASLSELFAGLGRPVLSPAVEALLARRGTVR